MIPFRTLFLGLAILAGPISPLAATGTVPLLALDDQITQTRLPSGQSVTVSLPAKRTDYLRGNLSIGAGHAHLDMIDGEGRHLRRLLDNATGAADFQFVLERDDVLLRLTATDEAVDLRLSLVSKVGAQEQRAPTLSYLSPTMAALAQSVEAGGDTETFWKGVEARGTPLVEPGEDGNVIATFLWRGAKRNVRMFGAPSGDHENLERIGKSDVWFKSFMVPPDTRLSYQLAPDVPDLPGSPRERRVAILATAQDDPFNHHPWPADGIDRFNRDSIFELPSAPPQPWLAERNVPKGSLESFTLKSEELGNERRITIYRPPGFDPGNKDNVLLFVFDAAETLTKIPTPTVLDNMIAAGVLPPTLAVFIANPGAEARAAELPANPVFADFMAEELLPRVIADTGMTASAERTVLAGASYGGLASMTVALRHPDKFGNVLSMSGSYWWSPPDTPQDRRNHIAWLLANNPVPKLRFFLSAGLFEIGQGRGVASILDTNRHVRDILLAKNSQVFYREYAGGHDYLIWRGTLSDGLTALFGK